MSITVSLRLDKTAEEELAALTSVTSSRNAAVVEAIHQSYRQLVYARMEAESRAAYDNAADRAEVEAAGHALGGDDAW
jgi:hypothetical protein